MARQDIGANHGRGEGGQRNWGGRREQWRERRNEREEQQREQNLVLEENFRDRQAEEARALQRTGAPGQMAAQAEGCFYPSDHFEPQTYPRFDGIIAKAYMNDAFRNGNHPRYAEYEPTRQNVAAVRNFVYETLFPNGTFNANDPKANLIPQMAREIGVALQRGNHPFFHNPFTRTLDPQVANTPVLGASAMYQLLLDLQNRPSFAHPIAFLMGKNQHQWGLPPIEQTPFNPYFIGANLAQRGEVTDGDANVAGSSVSSGVSGNDLAALAAPALAAGGATLATVAGMQNKGAGLTFDSLAPQNGALPLAAPMQFQSVDTMQEPAKQDAVEEAKEILRRLKLRTKSGQDAEGLSMPPDQTAEMRQAASAFQRGVQDASQLVPDVQALPGAIAGLDVAGKLVFLAASADLTRASSNGDAQRAQQITREIEALPPEARNATPAQLRQLLEQLEQSADEVSKAKAAALARQMAQNPQGQSAAPIAGISTTAALAAPKAAPPPQQGALSTNRVLMREANRQQRHKHDHDKTGKVDARDPKSLRHDDLALLRGAQDVQGQPVSGLGKKDDRNNPLALPPTQKTR